MVGKDRATRTISLCQFSLFISSQVPELPSTFPGQIGAALFQTSTHPPSDLVVTALFQEPTRDHTGYLSMYRANRDPFRGAILGSTKIAAGSPMHHMTRAARLHGETLR